jgi:hypothetical protein
MCSPRDRVNPLPIEERMRWGGQAINWQNFQANRQLFVEQQRGTAWRERSQDIESFLFTFF